MSGWIKLHRSLLEWEWYDDVNVMRLFLHCILKANHKDKKHKGTLVLRGSFLTGFDVLSKQTGISVQSIRTAVSKLESTNDLTRQSTSKGTVLTVINYSKYQDDDREVTSQLTSESTNHQQTSNKPSTSNNKGNNIRMEEPTREYSAPAPDQNSIDSSISSTGEPLPAAKMTYTELMKKVNELRPEWSTPSAWSYAEQRILAEGVGEQMLELTDEQWKLLKQYLKTPLERGKGFWRPTGRNQLCRSFSDVWGHVVRWAEKTPHLQKKLKPKIDPDDELAQFD